jgi:hypothetical protein
MAVPTYTSKFASWTQAYLYFYAIMTLIIGLLLKHVRIVANLFSILADFSPIRWCPRSRFGHVNDETNLSALAGYTTPPVRTNYLFPNSTWRGVQYSIPYSVCSTLHKCLFLSVCLRKHDVLFHHNKEYIFLHIGFDPCRSKCWNFSLHFSVPVRHQEFKLFRVILPWVDVLFCGEHDLFLFS